MIAKHVSMKTVKKSDFSNLVKYITDEQAKNERVGHVVVTNCYTDRPDVAITEVLNTQAQNTRSGADKTYHLIISFRPGEQPDDETLKAIEARICEGMGFGEHQRVSAVHHDTDNLHIHIAINKIHPTRYTIQEPFNAYHTLGQLCEKLEREFGLERDNHRASKLGSENKADDMERHAGIESLLSWVKRECVSDMQAVKSWEELHQVMKDNGLELRERGNGFVIEAGDGLAVKASSIGREFSKAKLEAKLGAFEPSPEHLDRMTTKPRRQYDKQPMRSRVNTVELHAKYKTEQQKIYTSRTAEWTKARDRRTRLIEDVQRSGRLKRAAIKLVKGVGVGKKVMYTMASNKQKDEIEKINAQYLKDRQEINEKYQRRAWADWLRSKAVEGDQDALGALRSREAVKGLTGNTVTGTGGKSPERPHAEQDSITKKGTIIYRTAAAAVRDDGHKLKVSRGADQKGLQSALRMAMTRYGSSIRVGGTAAFKEQIAQAAAAASLPITFDDPVLEMRRQELLKISKEKVNDQQTNSRANSTQGTKRGRTDSRRNGDVGHPIAGVNPSGAGSGSDHADGRRRKPVPGGGLPGKPNIGGVGRKPPPQSQNRLRGLSELGVVLITSGGEVLLPGHVPDHMEQQGAKTDNGVRRDISRAGGGLNIDFKATDKYIAERELKRSHGFDISKHVRYTPSGDGMLEFAGIRQIEGQSLALLKHGNETMVLPVDDTTARRLKRLSIGQAVTVTPQGSIKTKGRSR